MGKGRQLAATTVRMEEQDEVSVRLTGGGQGRGRGRVVPSTSKAKKRRSMEELLGVRELQLPPMGLQGVTAAGSALREAISSSSSINSVDCLGLKAVEGAGVFADVEGAEEVVEGDKEEDEDGVTRLAGLRLDSNWTEQGKSSKLGQLGDYLHTVERCAGGDSGGKGVGRPGLVEVRRSERMGDGPRDRENALKVFDVMPNRVVGRMGAVRAIQAAAEEEGSRGVWWLSGGR